MEDIKMLLYEAYNRGLNNEFKSSFDKWVKEKCRCKKMKLTELRDLINKAIDSGLTEVEDLKEIINLMKR